MSHLNAHAANALWCLAGIALMAGLIVRGWWQDWRERGRWEEESGQ